MAIDPNYSSSSSTIDKNYKYFSIKKGLGFGAFGGFIAAIVFAGILLFLPVILNFPIGTFFIALGELIFGFQEFDISVTTGITGFSLILIHGILIGIVFGFVTSSVTKLYPRNKKKGIVQGLCIGIISFIIIGIPLVYYLLDNINQILSIYPGSLLSIKGLGEYTTSVSSFSQLFPITFSIFFISYIFFGILLGGIVTLAYAVYHYDLNNIKEEKKG
jgi:hypothetical protein